MALRDGPELSTFSTYEIMSKKREEGVTKMEEISFIIIVVLFIIYYCYSVLFNTILLSLGKKFTVASETLEGMFFSRLLSEYDPWKDHNWYQGEEESPV